MPLRPKGVSGSERKWVDVRRTNQESNAKEEAMDKLLLLKKKKNEWVYEAGDFCVNTWFSVHKEGW